MLIKLLVIARFVCMWKSSSWVLTALWVSWKTFFTTKAVKYWNRLPERLCRLHLWKFSKSRWISPEYLHQPRSWQCFEEEVVFQRSWGPFQPESSCGPMNWRWYWGQFSVHSGSAVFCGTNSAKDFYLSKSGGRGTTGEVDFSSRRAHAAWVLYPGFGLNVLLGVTAGTVKNIPASFALLPPSNMNSCLLLPNLDWNRKIGGGIYSCYHSYLPRMKMEPQSNNGVSHC